MSPNGEPPEIRPDRTRQPYRTGHNGPFLGIAQNGIGLICFLELVLRLLAALIAVRVVLHRKLAKCLLDVILGGVPLNAEYFVIVFHLPQLATQKVYRKNCRSDSLHETARKGQPSAPMMLFCRYFLLPTSHFLLFLFVYVFKFRFDNILFAGLRLGSPVAAGAGTAPCACLRSGLLLLVDLFSKLV